MGGMIICQNLFNLKKPALREFKRLQQGFRSPNFLKQQGHFQTGF